MRNRDGWIFLSPVLCTQSLYHSYLASVYVHVFGLALLDPVLVYCSNFYRIYCSSTLHQKCERGQYECVQKAMLMCGAEWILIISGAYIHTFWLYHISTFWCIFSLSAILSLRINAIHSLQSERYIRIIQGVRNLSPPFIISPVQYFQKLCAPPPCYLICMAKDSTVQIHTTHNTHTKDAILHQMQKPL